ncbi:hypothetical protein BDQ17DRAFT_1362577 [Cyathus striatus]|nr:hypothetical protein BDQ17DRAFT_1362577 [Cyathus striatus]
MPSFLQLFRYIFTFITPYNDMKSAMEDSAQVKSIIKKLSAQRAICLMIDLYYCRTNAHQGRSNWAALILGAILFTGRISLAFDGLNEEQFTMQLRIIGPEIYTIVNMLPAMILQLISIALVIAISCSCFALGFASFVAAGVLGVME